MMEPLGSAMMILVLGLCSLRARPAPVRVPPEPTPQMKAPGSSPVAARICSMISGPVDS